MRGMEKDVFPTVSLVVASRTADADGASVDLLNYQGATIVGLIGAEGVTLTSTDKIEFELEESDDDSAWTDVADADLIGFVAGTNDGCFAVFDANAGAPAVVKAAYIGAKRYIRAVANFSGTHGTGTPLGVYVIGQAPRHTTGAPV